MSSVTTSINIQPDINTYTLTELYSGMNYTISIIVGDTQGQSLPVTITQQTLPTGIYNTFIISNTPLVIIDST